MNNKHLLIALGLLLACNHATYAQKGKSKEAKTTFQTSEPWKPEQTYVLMPRWYMVHWISPE